MPKADEIDGFRAVPYPPTNPMLIDLINAAINYKEGREGWTKENLIPVRACMDIVAKKGADKAWLLKVLWCFDNNS